MLQLSCIVYLRQNTCRCARQARHVLSDFRSPALPGCFYHLFMAYSLTHACGPIRIYMQLWNCSLLVVAGLTAAGPIPPELGNLSALQNLGLSMNELIGELWIPPQSDFSGLSYTERPLTGCRPCSSSVSQRCNRSHRVAVVSRFQVHYG